MTAYVELFNQIGNLLIFWSAAVGIASVAVHLRVRWWASPLGRHLLAYMTIIATVLTLSSVKIVFGDSPTFQLVRLIVFLGVPIVMTQRLVLQVRAQRGTLRAVPGTKGE